MCLRVSITSGAKWLRTQLTSPGIQENIQELEGILEMFFFNCVTGAKCFFVQFQLQKIAEVEGVAIL